MNKNKKVLDITGYRHKNTFDHSNKNLPSNIHPIHPDKKNIFDISIHNKQNKIKDNDFKDITNIVRNSVEKINNLFNQTEFQTKNKYFQKTSKELKFEINDINESDELNKSNEIKKKERSSTLEKSSKDNFTFNINNFINVPNISTTLPNMTQISREKNSAEIGEKRNLKSAASNTNKNNKVYLNNINNKKNWLIEHKAILSKKNNLIENNNNNYSAANDSLFQIDEIQNNNKSKINAKNNNTSFNQKNIKLSTINSRASKTNYNININKITDLSKSIKEVKESGNSTPFHTDNNNTVYSGLSTINQNKKMVFKMPINKRKDKEHSNLNTAQKPKYNNQPLNRQNKHKIKQNDNNQNKQNIKRNNDLYKNKLIKNKQILSQSKKLFKTGENFYNITKEKDKNENTNGENNEIENLIYDENTKMSKNEEKTKIKYESNSYKHNNINSSNNFNITVKTMDEVNNGKYKKNIFSNNISDRVSLANSPVEKKNQRANRRGGSIPYERRMNSFQEKDEIPSYSSSRAFHQVINAFYSKEFPNKINTNEILKLMLFLNEYLINNNLLSDYYDKKNKKLLEDYSKYISSKIKVDFPQEQDIVVDSSVECVKKIQRKWRKRKIDKYLEKNKKSEITELKHMIVNKYIQKSGYKIKKILGLFNTMVENFDNIKNQPDINELFYQIQKLIHNKLTEYEKNLLYKEFINMIIYNIS